MPRFAVESYGFLRPTYSPQCVFLPEHMSMYVHWLQNSCNMSVQHSNAPFPTAREFNAFIRAQGPRYPQAIHQCQHPRHPYDTASPKYCPVCAFKIHENYLTFINVAWARKGAPWVGNKADEEYEKMKHAHLIARMVFANHMNFVEDMARQEHKWNVEHPKQDTSSTYSNFKVMGLYRSWIDQRLDPPRSSRRRPGRKVAFSDSTEDFTAEESRPRSVFSRRSPHYAAGRHACPSNQGWEDSSGAYSYTRLLFQCKLYVVESAEDMTDLNNPPRNAKYLGFLADYSYQEVITSRIEEMSQKSSDQAKFLRWLKSSDAVLVLKPEVRVRHARNENVFEDVRPVCLEKDKTVSIGPTRWDVRSDPSAFGEDEMDWE